MKIEINPYRLATLLLVYIFIVSLDKILERYTGYSLYPVLFPFILVIIFDPIDIK